MFLDSLERIPAITYTAEFGETAPWLYVSPQIEDILGFTPDEWMARPNLWSRQLHPEDRERVMVEEERSHRLLCRRSTTGSKPDSLLPVDGGNEPPLSFCPELRRRMKCRPANFYA